VDVPVYEFGKENSLVTLCVQLDPFPVLNSFQSLLKLSFLETYSEKKKEMEVRDQK